MSKTLLMRVCWVGIGLGILLVALCAKSFVSALLDLQARVPRDPVALFGNMLVILSALVLIFLKRK